MSGALDTLFYYAQKQGQTLFLNAQFHPDLDSDVVCQQYFQPYYCALQSRGFHVLNEIPDEHACFNSVWIAAPKNIIEAQYLIVRGASLLLDGGTLFVAADNNAGGTRLKKWMVQFGFQDVGGDSRNKARICWGTKGDFVPDDVLNAGARQPVLNGTFLSQPGVFGWDKIDKGSDVLVRHLPEKLKGKGADFGCGYGFLSHFLLQKYPKISKLYCLDADYRSVGLCEDNIRDFDAAKEFIWCDLTQPQNALRNLDFVVMNPPFHEGKNQDVQVGYDFIRSSHAALRRHGVLWIVANAHLPYEQVLENTFFKVQKACEVSGFKVFECIK